MDKKLIVHLARSNNQQAYLSLGLISKQIWLYLR